MLKIIQTVLARKARDIVSLRNPFTFGIFLFTYPFCLIKTRIYWGQFRDFFLAVRVASRLYRRCTGMHVNFYVNLPKLCFWMANETELLEGLCPSFFDPQIFYLFWFSTRTFFWCGSMQWISYSFYLQATELFFTNICVVATAEFVQLPAIL